MSWFPFFAAWLIIAALLQGGKGLALVQGSRFKVQRQPQDKVSLGGTTVGVL
jgi:hypothetical protein